MIFEKTIPSKIELPLDFIFQIDALKNNNFKKINIIQFHEDT